MVLEIKELKSKASKVSSRAPAATAAKSPGTIQREKHELKLFEFKKKAEVKQMMKERDREHDNDVRNERVNKMSKFSLDSMRVRGDGKFVSSMLSVYYIIFALPLIFILLLQVSLL
jgi:cytoskeletal protein RodZ